MKEFQIMLVKRIVVTVEAEDVSEAMDRAVDNVWNGDYDEEFADAEADAVDIFGE